MESPLRLVVSHPLDELSRTVEALLVVASAPLSLEELAAATRRSGDSIRWSFQVG